MHAGHSQVLRLMKKGNAAYIKGNVAFSPPDLLLADHKVFID